MAWTTPRDWTTSELVTATIMNTHVRDNLNILYPTPGIDALPGSPTEYQQALVIGSTGYSWHCIYTPSTIGDAYKWRVIGGSPVVGTVADISHANQTSYTMTNSPAATVAPFAGVYDIHITGTAQRQTGTVTTYWSYNINSSGAADDNASVVNQTAAGALHLVNYQVTLAASAQVRIAYRQSDAGSNQYLDNACVALVPHRII